MSQSNQQNPIWAWVVMICGAIFCVSSLPGIILTTYMHIRQQSATFFSIMGLTFVICVMVVVFWGMKRAWKTIKLYNEYKAKFPIIEMKPDSPSQEKKTIWPWVVIGLGALAVLGMGPGVIMLPIMPLFLAGMSTDSGTTPDYVPMLILLIGYGLIISYIVLLVKAIKKLRNK